MRRAVAAFVSTVVAVSVSVAAASVVSATPVHNLPRVVTTANQAELNAALVLLNSYRAQAGMAAVSLDQGMDAGSTAHARYMSDHDAAGHTEDTSAADYSAAGATAAACGDEFPDLPTMSDAITGWMRAPYHESLLLDPTLSIIGMGRVGQYESFTCATSLSANPPSWVWPGPAYQQALFPPDGGTLPWLSWWGGEIPDPTNSCSDSSIAPSSVQGADLYTSYDSDTLGDLESFSATVTGPSGQLRACVVDMGGSLSVITLKSLQPSTHYSWTVNLVGSLTSETVTHSFTTEAAVTNVDGPGNTSFVQDRSVGCFVSSPDNIPSVTSHRICQLRYTINGGSPVGTAVRATVTTSSSGNAYYTLPASLVGRIRMYWTVLPSTTGQGVTTAPVTFLLAPGYFYQLADSSQAKRVKVVTIITSRPPRCSATVKVTTVTVSCTVAHSHPGAKVTLDGVNGYGKTVVHRLATAKMSMRHTTKLSWKLPLPADRNDILAVKLSTPGAAPVFAELQLR